MPPKKKKARVATGKARGHVPSREVKTWMPPVKKARVVGGVKAPVAPVRVEQLGMDGIGPPTRPIEEVLKGGMTPVASVPMPVQFKPNQWEMRSFAVEMPLKDMLDNAAHYLAWVYCSEEGHRVPIKGKEPAWEVPCPACRASGTEIIHEALSQLRQRGVRT